MNSENLVDGLGQEFGKGLRETSGYEETQKMIADGEISKAALDETPPVGLNLQILSRMESISRIKNELNGHEVCATMLGLAIADGAEDFGRFINTALGTKWNRLLVVDIDSTILEQVDERSIPDVITLHCDARKTGIANNSQNIVIRDHLGNCCPPAFDRAIDAEATRILKPGGIAIVNITTSEILTDSPNREVVPFEILKEQLGESVITSLQEKIYDLTQLKEIFGDHFEFVRGKLLEIEHGGSFVVFGEDEHGHGEWFRSLDNHVAMWDSHGFDVIEIATREGNDSHKPKLRCRRHNIVMRKKR